MVSVVRRLLARSPSAASSRDLSGHLLFLAYIVSIAAVIDTNTVMLPERVLLWFVLPLFVVALIASRKVSGADGMQTINGMLGSTVLWACVAYVVVMISSTVASRGILPAEGRAIGLYCRWGLELIVFLAVTAFLFDSYPRFFKRFIIAMGLLLAFNALVNIAAFLYAPTYYRLAAPRLDAEFGTPAYHSATHLGPLFSIYAMAALGMAATAELQRRDRWLVGVCTVILLIAIALTQARGALVAVFVGMLVIAVAGSWRWRVPIAAIVMLTIATVLLYPPLRELAFERGASFRTELWVAYLNLAKAQPMLGYGLDRLIEVEIRDTIFEQPHNSFVWAQVRGGWFGAAAAILMMLGSLFFSFRFWRAVGDIGPFVAILMLAVSAMTEIGFLVYPYNWLWITFWLPIGLGVGTEVSLRNRLSVPAVHRTTERSSRELFAPD